MKKKLVGILVITLFIGTALPAVGIINGNVPITTEVPLVDHKIVIDPNYSPHWNKWNDDNWGEDDSIHDSDSDENYGYAFIKVDTLYPGTDEEGGAWFKHWIEWTPPCDVTDAWAVFIYRLDSIYFMFETTLWGWAQARADYLFFVDDHESKANLFSHEGKDGQGLEYQYHERDEVGEIEGLTFEKDQTYNIGVQFKIYAHCSGPANSRVIVENTWYPNDWDDPTEIRIYWPNTTPKKPNPPNGPTSGYTSQSYSYEVSTTDYDTDRIFYQFDWDDGPWSDWYGPYDSGETCEKSHIWFTEGTYDLRVRAKDEEYGSTTGWSDLLRVTIPRSKPSNFNFNLFDWYLERFPILERLLTLIRAV